MKFCPACENILIPVNKKLFCKACSETYDIKKEDAEEYVIVKHIKHEDSEALPMIIKNGLASTKISAQDRKAYEEFFGKSEESGY